MIHIDLGQTRSGVNAAAELPQTADTKSVVIGSLKNAMEDLAAAYKAGVNSNALAADLPVFVKIQDMQKEIGTLMLAVNKLRGL